MYIYQCIRNLLIYYNSLSHLQLNLCYTNPPLNSIYIVIVNIYIYIYLYIYIYISRPHHIAPASDYKKYLMH